MSNSSIAERLGWADLIRVIAIFGVVLIHTCGPYFYQFGSIAGHDWLIINLLDSVVRGSVPLFFMLSGALLLHPGNTEFDIINFIRRLLRITVPLIFWSIYYLQHVAQNSGVPPIWSSILVAPAMYHLWFVYVIIGVYLMFPLFQAVFNYILASPKFVQVYILGLWLVITSIPVYLSLPILSIMQLKSFFGYGGYFVLGAVLSSLYSHRLSSFFWLVVWMLGAGLTFSITWYLTATTGVAHEKAYQYLSPNVFLMSVAGFMLIRRVSLPVGSLSGLKRISDLSFVIYFVHIMVLEIIKSQDFFISLFNVLPLGIWVIIMAIVAFILSLIVAFVLRLIPGAKHVIG